MTRCSRCKREIDAEKAVWSFTRRKHYCGPRDWPECDRLLAERLEREKAEIEEDAP